MATSSDRYPWFNPYSAAQTNIRRLRTPIHYNLRRHDFVAALAEIRAGADPTMVDECGRTALDLVVQMIVEFIQTVLCTSFPVDFIDDCLYRSSCNFKGYDDLYRNLYQQPNYFRYIGCSPCPSANQEMKNYSPPVYPATTSAASPSSALGRRDSRGRFTERDIIDDENSVCFPLPEAGKPTDDIPTDCQLIQQDVLIVVETAFEEPMPQKVIARMQELLRRLKASSRLMKLLAECACLRDASARTAASALQQISYPFFYTALLHSSFKTYPLSPSGELWDVENPADARRLVNILIHKELRGNEMYKFVGAIPKYVLDLVEVFGPKILNQKPEVAQYFMHMAFVLDSPKLFELVARQPNVFSIGDVFKWEDMLVALMQYKDKFPRFTSTLLSVRLKARIRKRLTAYDDEEGAKLPEKVQMPYEERFLKRNVIDNYSDFYGKEKARELEKMLKEWKYGAYRSMRS